MNAFVIYADLPSFVRAHNALQQSALNTDFAVRWNISPWRVDMLKFPPTANDALTEAIDAHLIMFAGRSAQLFPFWFQNWLEQWAKYRRIEDAALAVIGEEDKKAVPEQSDLSQFAKRHGLSVIINDRDSIEDSLFHTESLQKLKSDMSLIMPQTLDKGTQDSYRGWGINV